MTGTILVPLDGSDLAERALPFAVALAKRGGQRLLLVRAVPTYEFTPQGDSPDGVAAKLEAAAGRARREGVEVETQVAPVVLSSGIAEAIRDLARAQSTALIVMTTHGRGGLGRWIYGSVADAVLRHAEVPVLLVPSATTADWSQSETLTALVPLDGSGLAEEALVTAAELADSLLVGRVVEPISYAAAEAYAAIDWDAELAEARRYLEGVVATQRAAGRTIELVEPIIGPISVTIADMAEQKGAGLVVMATHGRGGLSRLVLGSVAGSVLQWARTPVLLVRPGVARHEQGAAPGALPRTVSVTVTADELEVVARALAHLTFADRADPALARPARELLQRLHALQGDLRAAGGRETGVALTVQG